MSEPDSDTDAATTETAEDREASSESTVEGNIFDVIQMEEPPSDITVDDAFVERIESIDAEQIASGFASLRMRIHLLESKLDSLQEESEESTEQESTDEDDADAGTEVDGEAAAEAVADVDDEDLRSELEETKEKLKRKQAEFQNYKKRMKKRREEEKQRATEDLVERLLDVRDNLQRALEQDEDADIRDGIEATLRQFDEELERENVDVIQPEPGDEVDPKRHEVLLRVESDQPEGTVAAVSRPGYEMAGKVIRTAQVTVSDDET